MEITDAISGRIKDVKKSYDTSGNIFGSLKDSKGVFARLYPTKESIQSQLVDINKIFPEQADGYFGSLLSKLIITDKQVKENKTTWQDYYTEIGDSSKWISEFVQSTDLQKASIDDVKVAYDNARKAAEQQNIALQQTTLASKAASAGFKLLAAAGNAAFMWLATQVVTKVAESIYNYVNRVKLATEAMESAAEEAKSLKDELSDVTSELEEQETALNALLSKGGQLTYAEKSELENLKDITAELRLQQDILERQAEQAQRNTAEKAVESYETQYGYLNPSEDVVNNKIKFYSQQSGSYGSPYDESYITDNIVNYALLSQALDDVNLKLEDTETLTEESLITYQEEAQRLLGYIEETEDILVTNLSDLSTQQANLSEEYDKLIAKRANGELLTSDDKEIIKTYEEIASLIKLIYSYYDKNIFNDMEFDEILSKADTAYASAGIKSLQSDLSELAQTGELTVTKLEEFPVLCAMIYNSDLIPEEGQTKLEAFCEQMNAMVETTKKATSELATFSDTFALETLEGEESPLGALSSQVDELQTAWSGLREIVDNYNKTGSITVDQFQDLLSYGDEYIQYLIDENGNLQLNEEALKKVAAAKIENMKATVLNNLLSQLQTIKDEADAQEFLSEKVNGSTAAIAENTEAVKDNIEVWLTEMMLNDKISASTAQKVTDYVHNFMNVIDKTTSNMTIGSFLEADSETETDYADMLQNETDLLEKQLENHTITFDDYVNKRRDIIEKYYKDGLISAEEYYDALGDMYDYQLSVYDKVISAVENLYDEKIESIEEVIDGLEKENELLEKQLDKYDSALSAISKFLDAQKDLLQDNIDGIETENDAIQDEIDGYDQLLNAVTLVIDAKRESVEADKKDIQDRIDALQEENDEAKKAVELEQAKYELERLRSQRNKKLYVEGKGYIYDYDHSAIRDAEDNVADLTLDATISALEKEQEALDGVLERLDETEQKWQDIANAFENNKALEKAQEILGDNFKDIILEGDGQSINDILNAYIGAQTKLEENTLIIEDYEKRMEQLDAIAKKWEDVANIKQETEDAINAAELLGKDWQEAILADKLEIYDAFCTEYIDIQTKIEDNTLMIESYNEKVEYYQNLKQQWSDLAKQYEIEQNKLFAAELLGNDWEAALLDGRLDKLNDFTNKYNELQREQQRIAEETAAACEAAARRVANSSGGNFSDDLSEPNHDNVFEVVDTEGTTHAVYTTKAEAEAEAKRLDKEKEDERIFYRVNSYQVKYHDGLDSGIIGSRQYSDYDQLNILRKAARTGLKPDEYPIIAQKGEVVVTKAQRENLVNALMSNPIDPIGLFMNKIDKPEASAVNNNTQPVVTISIGTIEMHEINNVRDFASELEKHLPNISVQYNGRHK